MKSYSCIRAATGDFEWVLQISAEHVLEWNERFRLRDKKGFITYGMYPWFEIQSLTWPCLATMKLRETYLASSIIVAIRIAPSKWMWSSTFRKHNHQRLSEKVKWSPCSEYDYVPMAAHRLLSHSVETLLSQKWMTTIKSTKTGFVIQ